MYLLRYYTDINSLTHLRLTTHDLRLTTYDLRLKVGPQRNIEDRLFTAFYVPCQVPAHKVAEKRSAQAGAIAQGYTAPAGHCKLYNYIGRAGQKVGIRVCVAGVHGGSIRQEAAPCSTHV